MAIDTAAKRAAALRALRGMILPDGQLADPADRAAMVGAYYVTPIYVDLTVDLRWEIGASPARISRALSGDDGPVRLDYRFERRTIANGFLADVSEHFEARGCSIDGNNDRDVFRTATFAMLDNDAVNPLADHIAVIGELLVDHSLLVDIPAGLFALNVPRKSHRPGLSKWAVVANDLTMHLIEATTTSSYTVASGANYITGTNGVKAILDALGLRNALPANTLTLPVARTWAPGTTWLRVVNDLLHDCNFYSLWFDATGVAVTRVSDDLLARTADATYADSDFVLIPIDEEADTTRFANQVVVYVDDPARAPLSSVRTNADPDSPTSTVTLGRTITKTLQSTAADQTTLDAIAVSELQQAGSMYRRATLVTQPDPRRGAHEVLALDVDGVFAAENWWSRNWVLPLANGAQMKHAVAKVEKVVAS